jgi:hypothetical protein
VAISTSACRAGGNHLQILPQHVQVLAERGLRRRAGWRADSLRARLREQLVHGTLAARGHIQGPLVLAAVVVAAAGLVRLHRTGSLRRLLGEGAAALVLAVQQRLRVIGLGARAFHFFCKHERASGASLWWWLGWRQANSVKHAMESVEFGDGEDNALKNR